LIVNIGSSCRNLIFDLLFSTKILSANGFSRRSLSVYLTLFETWCISHISYALYRILSRWDIILHILVLICVISHNNPGRSRYVGSYRTGFGSVAARQIGFGRLLFAGFRCYPLFSFDICWSNSSSSNQIHTAGTGQIRSQNLFASDVIQGNLMSRNDWNLSFPMKPDFMIKSFNHWYRNLPDYIRIQKFHWSEFFVLDNIDLAEISYWCISEIIRKLCKWFSVMARVL
jgi:hypothetical protein